MANRNTILAFPTDNISQAAACSWVGSADPAYPASLAVDFTNGDTISKAARSTLLADTLLLDFGGSKSHGLAGIWHNGDPSVAITVKGGSTTSTTDYSVALVTPFKKRNRFTVKLAALLTGVTGNVGGRYMAFQFGANSVPPGLKVVVFSQYVQLNHQIKRAPQRDRETRQLYDETAFGVEWLYDLKGGRDRLSMECDPDDSDLAQLQNWIDDHGDGSPSCIMLDPQATIPEGLIGRPDMAQNGGGGLVINTLSATLQSRSYRRHTVKFKFREFTAGLPEWD